MRAGRSIRGPNSEFECKPCCIRLSVFTKGCFLDHILAMSRHRNWVFTLNNPNVECNMCELFGDVSGCVWAAGQLEKAPSTGTIHWQGACVFRSAKSLSAMKRLLPGAHFEVMRGHPKDSEEYCSKEESRWTDVDDVWSDEHPRMFEYGDCPERRQGRRNDLVEVKEKLDAGVGMREIADEHFGSFVRYNRGFQVYRQLRQAQRTWVTTTTVLFGPPGTGKTRRALEEAGGDAYWLTKPNSTRAFWDGYDGQENVVIDEFYGWLPINMMKRLCDRYPMQVETKGSAVPFLARKIWITSNSAPEAWWPKAGLGAMARRLRSPLGECWRMDALGEEPQLHNPVEQLPYFSNQEAE